MHEALYYEVIDKSKSVVQCHLCPHRCKIAPDKTGTCSVRKNVDGKLFSLTYNRTSSINLDPIEKKPLYHFYPGSEILSVGTVGCTFRCLHCQNWEISTAKPVDFQLRELTSQDALELARQYNSIGISYTYNEPLMNYEWLLETSKTFNGEGLKNVLVTNGYINENPLLELIPYVDAANIDVKGFTEEFYRSVCGARLDAVLKTVETMYGNKKHVEVTYLVITNKNDSEKEISGFIDWLSSVGTDIPLHFSRYFPQHKMTEPPTPQATLLEAADIASKKMKFVYIGNIYDKTYSDTNCPHCGNKLIDRMGYLIKVVGFKEGGICNKCQKEIPGRF